MLNLKISTKRKLKADNIYIVSLELQVSGLLITKAPSIFYFKISSSPQRTPLPSSSVVPLTPIKSPPNLASQTLSFIQHLSPPRNYPTDPQISRRFSNKDIAWLSSTMHAPHVCT
jgi:hypothetical protein